MKSLAPFSLILLAAASGPLCAEPDAYGPAAGPGYAGPPEAPFAGSGAAPWVAPGGRHGAPFWAPRPGQGAEEMPAGLAPDSMGRGPGGMGTGMQAAAVLKAGMDKLLEFLGQAERPNNLQVAAFLDREVAPYFDFDYMAQWVSGPAYAGMTPEEKKALSSQLEADFLATLARNLAGYEGQQVKMLAPRPGPRGSVKINVVVLQPGTYPTRLEFRLSESGSSWKVYDVVANGQSAASYYRHEFQRKARQELGYVPR